MSKIDHSLFNTQESAFDPGMCPICQSPLKLRHSKNGAFIGCSDYPNCEYSKPLHESDNTEHILLGDTNDFFACFI
jgi:putative DNA topoisomerase